MLLCCSHFFYNFNPFEGEAYNILLNAANTVTDINEYFQISLLGYYSKYL